MTRKMVAYGIGANVAFWGFVALTALTEGFALAVLVFALVVAVIFFVGSSFGIEDEDEDYI